MLFMLYIFLSLCVAWARYSKDLYGTWPGTGTGTIHSSAIPGTWRGLVPGPGQVLVLAGDISSSRFNVDPYCRFLLIQLYLII